MPHLPVHLTPPALCASAEFPTQAPATMTAHRVATQPVPAIAAVPFRARFRYRLPALARRNLLLRASAPLPTSRL